MYPPSSQSLLPERATPQSAKRELLDYRVDNLMYAFGMAIVGRNLATGLGCNEAFFCELKRFFATCCSFRVRRRDWCRTILCQLNHPVVGLQDYF